MPCTVIVGTQFGDEGKGKIVDYYSGDMDVVVRYNGGANAGHTVVVGKDEYAFQLLPSGILRRDKTVMIGNGVALDPEVFLNEVNNLKKRGIIPAQIFISDRAHVVMPYHKIMDGAQEKFTALAGLELRVGFLYCFGQRSHLDGQDVRVHLGLAQGNLNGYSVQP